MAHVQGEKVIEGGNTYSNTGPGKSLGILSRAPNLAGDFDTTMTGTPNAMGARPNMNLWLGDDEVEYDESESSQSESSDSSSIDSSSSSSSSSKSSQSSNSSSSSSSSS